jgi:MFS family permease
MMLAGGLVTWILLTDGVRDIAYSMTLTLMPLYQQGIAGLTIQQIGWLTSIFGLAMMLITIPAGWLADRKSERAAIALGFLLQSAALVFFLRALSFWGHAAAMALLGLGTGLMSPAYMPLITKAVPEKVRGTAFGLFQTSLGLVSLPVPALSAQLWERVNPRFPFNLASWLVALTAIPVWLKFRLPANGAAEAAVAEPGSELVSSGDD